MLSSLLTGIAYSRIWWKFLSLGAQTGNSVLWGHIHTCHRSECFLVGASCPDQTRCFLQNGAWGCHKSREMPGEARVPKTNSCAFLVGSQCCVSGGGSSHYRCWNLAPRNAGFQGNSAYSSLWIITNLEKVPQRGVGQLANKKNLWLFQVSWFLWYSSTS